MRRVCTILLCTTAILGGCASASKKPPEVNGAGRSSRADAIRNRLTSADNGLEVHRWMIRDQSSQAIAALCRHVDGQAADPDTLARLKRNGLRLARVPLDHLPTLIAEMGGADYDATEWHGQVCEWRSLLDHPIDAAGRAVAIDGMVRRYQSGEFRLMIRCWTVQMEDGRFLHMELLPQRRLPQTNDLKRLLGGETDWCQGFGSMALDAQLQADFAYVLVSESPQVDWPSIDADAQENETRAGKAEAIRPTGRAVAADFIGPDAAAPPTLGELLLYPQRRIGGRTVLVFVPKIPGALLLPEQLAAESPGMKGSSGS